MAEARGHCRDSCASRVVAGTIASARGAVALSPHDAIPDTSGDFSLPRDPQDKEASFRTESSQLTPSVCSLAGVPSQPLPWGRPA